MRIITGRARGTNLFTPKNYDVRPTADRVKESVFNILGSRIAGSRVLDAFAGTGNLGIESWSRGAERVVFLDKSRESLALVRRNLEKCHVEAGCSLLQGDALALVSKLAARGENFDFVFLDPPYRMGLIDRMLQVLVEQNLLRFGALIIAERAADEVPVAMPEALSLLREEKYGSTIVDFITTVC